MGSSARNHSFVVYIDESGDEGFVFKSDPIDKGSSRWFVMSAVIFHAESEAREVLRVDRVKAAIGKDSKRPLHFIELSHDRRVFYARMIAPAQMQIITVLVHKPSLYAPRFSEKYQLYWYISQFILERVSWVCRDRYADLSAPRCKGDGSARVIFSNRRRMPYDELKNKLRKMRDNGERSIDWSVISPDDVMSFPHSALKGLQVADLSASAFFLAVEKNRFGHTEDRYARALCHKLYKWSDKEKRLGYGLKVWPSEAKTIFEDVCDFLEY